jgi:2-oxoisovalerate dehydrogenase E2 component (dihydrolipoyl transacylase)
MTDKATIDIESPVSGTVVAVAGEVGDVIAIGAMLLVIEVEGEDSAAGEAEAAAEQIEDEMSDANEADVAPAPKPVAASAPVETAPEAPAPAAAAHKVLASPAVRQRARDLGVDLTQVKPAEDGRVRHGDLDAFLAYNAGSGFGAAGKARADETIKVIGLRKRIAQNMAAAKRHIPHFTYVEECDVTDLEVLRAQLNEGRGDRPKLTMLPLLITAICKTIPAFPMINARYDDEAGVVTRYGCVHLGIAAQTTSGLMVPVIRDAQSRNLWQLAREIGRLAEAARTGKASSEELSGSTLTVTSLGPLGGVATTPVINRPEVAIIGPNRIVERPMFISDGMGGERIAKRKLMNISISCDHRVVDGHDAASFVQGLKRLIETPALLLVD